MEATEMFLVRHASLHRHAASLLDGLTEGQVRSSVLPEANPIAWLLWHIARAEDAGVSRFVCDVPELLNEDWSQRLNVARCDVGTGMTPDEVAHVAATVDLGSLLTYWDQVGTRTRQLVTSLDPAVLDRGIADEQLHRAVLETVRGAVGRRLEQLWRGTSRGHLLVWLPLTHNYEHVGQVDLLRGLLGRPGRF